MRKTQCIGQKLFGNGYDTKRGRNRRGRGSEFAGLGFRSNDNAGSRYLLLQSVSASAASRWAVGTSYRSSEGPTLKPDPLATVEPG